MSTLYRSRICAGAICTSVAVYEASTTMRHGALMRVTSSGLKTSAPSLTVAHTRNVVPFAVLFLHLAPWD